MLRGALSNVENVDALHLNLNLSGCDIGDMRLIEELGKLPTGPAYHPSSFVSSRDEIGDRAGISPELVHLEPGKPYVLALASDATGDGALQSLQGFMTTPAGAAVVNATGPIRQLVRGEDKSPKWHFLEGTGASFFSQMVNRVLTSPHLCCLVADAAGGPAVDDV